MPISFSVQATARPLPISQKPVVTSPNKTLDWPPALKAFVDQCFSRCQTTADRDAVEVTLKELIQTAIKTGSMCSTDWTKVPLIAIPSLTPSILKNNLVFPSATTNIISARTESFAKKGKKPKMLPLMTPSNLGDGKKMERARRFEAEAEQERQRKSGDSLPMQQTRRKTALLALAESGIDWDEHTIIGTSQALEKPYLRLTSAPDPATVRPLPVLRRSLDFLKERWTRHSSTARDSEQQKKEYHYICDQFKSLRQDLTVQRIRNDFTVRVYETHARIALECADLGEYNQCQTQLLMLYDGGLPGKVAEFTAYRILYLMHTGNRQEMHAALAEIGPELSKDHAVIHALSMRKALALGNFYRFFQLTADIPNMGSYLVDHCLARERRKALLAICKAYRPNVSSAFLARMLGYNDDISTCRVFIEGLVPSFSFEAQQQQQQQLIDTKELLGALSNS